METAGNLEQEVETLIKFAVGEETENGSIIDAARAYASACDLLIARTKEVGTNDGFFVAMRPLLQQYLERARLLTDIAIDEEQALKEKAVQQ